MAGGLAISAIGFGLLTLVDQTGFVGLVIGSVVYSIGLSPVVILATDLIVGSARVEHAGAASAISETSSELGGALGIAILGSVGTAVYRSVIAQLAPQGIPHEALETARNTVGGALEVARRLSGQQGDQLLGASREAFTQAFELTALVCAGLTLTAAIATAFLLRNAAASPAVAEAAASSSLPLSST
jgi:DHA2 family multidrug resistance protein-like MFS transporter